MLVGLRVRFGEYDMEELVDENEDSCCEGTPICKHWILIKNARSYVNELSGRMVVC